MKKWISVFLCAIFLTGLLTSIGGCGSKPEAAASVSLEDGASYGQGDKAFKLTVADLDGKETSVFIATDKDTVGEALVELKIVEGEESEWGLYVKTVNGITLDYDKDGKYWAFYIDGEYAMTGVDSTAIESGSVYEFRPEQ